MLKLILESDSEQNIKVEVPFDPSHFTLHHLYVKIYRCQPGNYLKKSINSYSLRITRTQLSCKQKVQLCLQFSCSHSILYVPCLSRTPSSSPFFRLEKTICLFVQAICFHSHWVAKPQMSWSRLISWPICHQGIFTCNLVTCFASRSPPLLLGIFALNSMEINLFYFLLELELVMKSTSQFYFLQ